MTPGYALLFLYAAADPSQALRTMIEDTSGNCHPAPGEITICARRPGDSPYRLPEGARDPGFRIDGPMDSVARERHRLMDVGGAGAQQNGCSATGAAGATGCMLRDWQAADQQRGYRRR